MSRTLAPLLSRTAIDEVETQHDAVGRLVQAASNERKERSTDALNALRDLLLSPRLGVVSKACHGLVQILEAGDDSGALDVTEACSWVLKAIESVQAREPNGPGEARGECTVYTLMRCLISMCRLQARRKPEGAVGGVCDGDGQGFFSGVVTSLLSMNRGALHPTVLLEGTAFLGRSGIEPVEVLHVVGPLAAAVLLQPECLNLRGGFLLKLSVALAAASDAVRLSVLVFLTELLGFCAVHTAAHADVAGAWCGTLTNVALSLESDGAWDVASGVVPAAIVSLIIGFREYGMPISSLLRCLLSLADADPICLVDEVAFLGLTALHSPSVDDRETLLRIIGSVASTMPRWSVRSSEETSDVADSGSGVDVRMELWSIQALVYPVVCMAAAGNTAASTTLPAVNAALSRAGGSAVVVGSPHSAPIAVNAGGKRRGGKLTNGSSPVALAGRRLCALESSEDALVESCKGLQVRAEEAGRAAGNDDAREITATTRTDLESAFFVLGPLLLRPGPQRVHSAVCAATVALVRTIPSLGVRLLPFVLFAVRRLQGGVEGAGAIVVLLELLPELGRHKVAARPVAGVIQGFARATQTTVRAIGVRLASSLICTNSRTFTQLQGLLIETYERKNATFPEEADECRLSRAAGMLNVCSSEPELALDFVRSLQACLGDAMSAVAALALRAISALCRFDCLDFDAALRIVSKKGKVAHTGAFASGTEIEAEGDWGDELVMEALAELCGAGAEAAAAAREEDDEAVGENDRSEGGSESEEEPSWGMGKAVDTLLSPSLRCHPNEKVRAGVYTALCAHLPDLLKAERLEEAGDATTVAPRVRSFVWDSLVGERSPLARESLESAASVVLADESAEPSTWVPARRAGSSKGGAALGGGGSERVGPSNRLLATLPTPETVLQTFRFDASSSRGLAGAVLWCYPPAHAAASVRSSAKRVSAQAQRDEMISDLAHLLSAEGAGEGLGVCPWQRMTVPLGVQRYVKRLLAACIAAESDLIQGGDSGFGEAAADAERSAVMTCRRAIKDLRGVSRRLVALCSASLVSLIPNSLSHLALEEADNALDQLRASGAEKSGPAMMTPASRGIIDSGTSLPGDELIPLCAALATRALSMSAGSNVVEALSTIQAFAREVAEVDQVEGKDPVGDGARAIAVSNDGVLFWSTMSVGIASEWACRNPVAPEAQAVVVSGARYLLEGLGYALGSEHLMSLAEQTFGAPMRPGTQAPPVASWREINVGCFAVSSDTKSAGRPTTSTGSRCLAIFAGLSCVLPGLSVTGMHRELLQVFNVIRALQEVGVCGASLCLPSAVSECLSCGIIDSPAILECIRSLSLVVDSSGPEGGLAGKSAGGHTPVVAMETSGVRGENSTGNAARNPPPQDAWLGLAGLMVACEGNVLLPPGFAEAAFDKLRKAMVHRRGGDNGVRVASMFAMGSLFGCPILAGEFRPRRMRISSLTTRRMAELVLGDIEEAMKGTSIRARNAAARVWGCLSALGQDERCESDPALLQALGWAEDGSASSASLGGSGGPAGLISANALHVAREGSLMGDVLDALQRVATEGKLENGNTRGCGVAGVAGRPDSQPAALLAESALKCLQACASSLRVPHPQMAIVIAALFRGGHGLRVEAGCIDLAVQLGCKEQAYSSWLRGLLRTALFKNMMHETRSHLLSVFADVVLLLPAKIASSVVEEMSDYLIVTELQAGGREAGVPVAKENSSQSSDGFNMDAGCSLEQIIDLAVVFLSGLEQIAKRLLSSRSSTDLGSRSAGARDPTSSTVVLATINKVTADVILPALILRYTSRYRPGHTLGSMPRSEGCGGGQSVARDDDDSWKVVWDSVVGLLLLLPREDMESAIAFKPDVKPSRPVVGDCVDQAIRAYLIARLEGGRPLPAVDRNDDNFAGSTTQSKPLGSVLRWATRLDTDWDASASVLPHLARAVKNLPETLRNEWLRRILDMAGLSETCPVRAFALLGGTAAAWESSNLGSLVVGEETDSFVMPRSTLDLPNQGSSSSAESPGCVESGLKSRPRSRSEPSESSARLFSMSVAAPKAVMRLDKISAGVAEDMLVRMLRASTGIPKERIGAQAEEVRLCIKGFIKGMRHALPVVGRGTLSGQFAVYSRSVSTERVARVLRGGGGMGDLPMARYARGSLSG